MFPISIYISYFHNVYLYFLFKFICWISCWSCGQCILIMLIVWELIVSEWGLCNWDQKSKFREVVYFHLLTLIILCDKVFAYSSSILNSECWYCHQILLLICYTIYMLYRIKIKLIVSRKKIEHVKKLVYIRDLCIQQQIYDICIKIQIEVGSKKSDILHLN
jgi:hypothetical protein